MKKLFAVLFLVFLTSPAFAQFGGTVKITIVGGAAVQDTLDLKVNIKDTTSHAVGHYVTQTQHDTKVNKADTTSHAAGSYVTPTQADLKAPLASPTFTGIVTAGVLGIQFQLHAIAAGDSVVGKMILDAADTTLKVWKATGWKSLY